MIMTTPDAQDLRILLAALRVHLEVGSSRGDAIGDEVRNVSAALNRVDADPREVRLTRHPLIRYLPAALALTRSRAPEVASVLEPVAELLPWRYGYQDRADALGLENAMGWAELAGPEAPFRSREVCFGLTLIGPGRYYLPHHHPAIELYRVIAGRAEWTAGGQTATQRPGAYILHPANIIHAMHTGEEPLLAVYSWTGDVVSPSVWADAGVHPERSQP
jgi:hypothetical protein